MCGFLPAMGLNVDSGTVSSNCVLVPAGLWGWESPSLKLEPQAETYIILGS